MRVAGDSASSLDAGAMAAAQAPAATPAARRRPRPPRPRRRRGRHRPIPNPGAISFTGNMDVLAGTPYIFRGIVQESDPKLTLWPAGDIGIALYSGEKRAEERLDQLRRLEQPAHRFVGPRQSTSKKQHYEEDFYAALGLGFSKAAFTTTYTAYTSPNGLFGTVHEIAFKMAVIHKIAPYVLLAQELGAVGADGGANKGTYVELGIGPSWPVAGGKATIAIPVKVGLSAQQLLRVERRGQQVRVLRHRRAPHRAADRHPRQLRRLELSRRRRCASCSARRPRRSTRARNRRACFSSASASAIRQSLIPDR